MTTKNAKFAITTKEGRSVVLEFENYAQAQKYADRHFGKGAIVQVVGNRSRRLSFGAVVKNALATQKQAR